MQAKEIEAKAADRGIAALDAPVSGGDTGAKNGISTARESRGEGGDWEGEEWW